MHAKQRAIVRQTVKATLLCIIASVVITTAVTYIITGGVYLGLGAYLAVLVPAVLVPIGSYAHISMAAQLRDANARLRALSETDPLTQTFNRRRFLEVAVQQLALARRHCFPTSLLLIDFDNFKQINDRFGHATGDRVLIDATRLMNDVLRESDTLARFGGEEFIVLLPHTAREGALLVAERMMTAIRDHDFHHEGNQVSVTISIGGVTCETSESSLDTMTSRADRLLYASKQAGRDHCTIEGMQRQTALPFSSAGQN